tara:strand:+ start:210 stop:467 length:258 start_codon:yes stop_codon:yes gene_type:complete
MDIIAYMTGTQEERCKIAQAEVKRLQEKHSKPLCADYQPRKVGAEAYIKPMPENPVQVESTELKIHPAHQQGLADWYASREWHGD